MKTEARISKAEVNLDIALIITEREARALYALTEYGFDAFLKTFYQHMGESVLKPHASGLRSLFDLIRAEVSPMLRRADKARAAFRDTEAA